MTDRLDGWNNVLTGLGNRRDKRTFAKPKTRTFSRDELESLFEADDVARKVVTLPANDMFRRGYEIKNQENSQAADAMTDYFKRLEVNKNYEKAVKLARLHGGAGIVIGVNDGQESWEPLELNKIQSIDWLRPLDRWSLNSSTVDSDIASSNYGLPLTYRISSPYGGNSNIEIHHSRVIRFEGIELPDEAFIRNNYWGLSRIGAIISQIRDFSTAYESASHIMQDFSQAVYKLKELNQILASGDDTLLMKRLELLDATRSIVRAIVLDGDESFERVSTSIAGLPELLKQISGRMVASAEMPHTKILGEGSEGNTSGRSEIQDYYDMVSSEQENMLAPRMMRLMEMITYANDSGSAKGVPFENFSIKFWPLWEMDEKEQAEINKMQAETDQIYIMNGVLDPDEVARSRFIDNEESDIEVTERTEPLTTIEEEPRTDSDDPFLVSVVLSKAEFSSMDKAAAWIVANGFSNAQPEEKQNAFVFKQTSGKLNVDFQNLETKEIAQGVTGVMGIEKSEELHSGYDLMSPLPDGIDTTPTSEMSETASGAMLMMRKYTRKPCPFQFARGLNVRNRVPLSLETIKVIAALDTEKFEPGKSEIDGGPNENTLSIMLIGGIQGIEWARSKIEEYNGISD